MREVMSWAMLYGESGGRMVGNSDFKNRVSMVLSGAGEENSKTARRFLE